MRQKFGVTAVVAGLAFIALVVPVALGGGTTPSIRSYQNQNIDTVRSAKAGEWIYILGDRLDVPYEFDCYGGKLSGHPAWWSFNDTMVISSKKVAFHVPPPCAGFSAPVRAYYGKGGS